MSTVLITGLVQFNSQPPIPLVTILSLGIRKQLCLTKSGQLIWESVSRCRSHWSMSRQNHLGKEARWSEARSATANWLRRFLLSGVGQDPISSFRGESSYEGLPSPGKSPTGSIFVGWLALSAILHPIRLVQAGKERKGCLGEMKQNQLKWMFQEFIQAQGQGFIQAYGLYSTLVQ